MVKPKEGLKTGAGVVATPTMFLVGKGIKYGDRVFHPKYHILNGSCIVAGGVIGGGVGVCATVVGFPIVGIVAVVKGVNEAVHQ